MREVKFGIKVYPFQNAFLQQTLFLGSHHKVVCLILVVNNVLQVYTVGFIQVFKEFLVENECYPTDLLHSSLRLRIAVDEIGCDCNGQFASKFFPLKTYNDSLWQSK